MIRLKDEMDVVAQFAEILAISTGNSLRIDFSAESEEASNIYIPARSLLFFVRDIFIQEDVKAGYLSVRASAKENGIIVRMALHCMANDRLDSCVKDLEKRFESFYSSEIRISLNEQNNALWEILFELPKEK